MHIGEDDVRYILAPVGPLGFSTFDKMVNEGIVGRS